MKKVDLTQSALSSLEGLLRVKKLIKTIDEKLQEDGIFNCGYDASGFHWTGAGGNGHVSD